jgi:hypothetical protein
VIPSSPSRRSPPRKPSPTVRRSATPGYQNIDEVPPSEIRDLLMDSLQQFGSTEESDLTKEVARRLGFKRAGDRIKQNIGECVESLIREGKIGRKDCRLQVVAPRANLS